MPSLFDGIASVQRGIFGDPITIHPKDKDQRVITAVFREMPVELDTEIAADALEIREVVPVLKASIQDVEDLKTGDKIDAPNGKSYKCRPRQKVTSPAVDAMIEIPLLLIGNTNV